MSDYPTYQARAELFHFSIRNLVHEKPTLAIGRPGRCDPIWGEYFHLSVGSIRVLGARHSVAPFLSVLDVPRDHRTELERQSLGIFHWNFRSRTLGLYQYLRDHLLLQWTPTAHPVASHWAFGQTRSLDCSTRMVLQFIGDYRLLVGLCASIRQEPKGRCQARTFLRSDNGLFRPSHGSIPASLSGNFPPTIAPALAVRNLLGKNQNCWESTQASGQRLINALTGKVKCCLNVRSSD